MVDLRPPVNERHGSWLLAADTDPTAGRHDDRRDHTMAGQILALEMTRQRRITLTIASFITVVAGLTLSLPTAAASEASASADQAEDGTTFTSEKFPYTLVLPTGWRAVPDVQDERDLFDNPEGFAVQVNGRPSEPGDTAESRVAANRAELGAECQSDPADDRLTTLGGERAIAFTWTCPNSHSAAVMVVHDDMRFKLTVSVPKGSESQAAPLLEQLRQSFTVTDGSNPPTGTEADLAAIEAELQGTFENAWHPFDLELATVEAAGLDRQDSPDWWDAVEAVAATPARSAVKFQDGDIIQYGAIDGGPLEVGWVGRYRLLDDRTIEAIETGTFNRIVYEFTLSDDILTMDVVSNDEPVDMVPQTAIYETLPFARVP
jgi:hypothetical protein